MPEIMNKLDRIHDYFMIIGAMSGCHQMPERSFFIGKYQFPVCARCTGVFIGYAAGIVLLPFLKINAIISILMCLVMYVDWKIQKMKILNSTNIRRLITGLVCGVGMIHFTNFIMGLVRAEFTCIFGVV